MSGLLESLDRGEFIDEAVGFVAAVAPKLKAAVRLNISLPIKAGSGFMPPLTHVVPLPVNVDEGCVGTKQKAHQTKSKLFEEYGLSDSDTLANSHTPHTLVTLEKTVGAYLPAPSLLLKSSSVILPKESSSIKKAKVTGPSPAGLTAFELFCEDHRDKRGGIPAMSYARLKEMWGSVDSEIFENYDSRVVERQLSGIGIPADIFSVKSVQKDGRGKQKPAPKIVSAVFSSASPPPSSLLPRLNSSKSRGKRPTIESDDDGEGGEEENWGSENDVSSAPTIGDGSSSSSRNLVATPLKTPHFSAMELGKLQEYVISREDAIKQQKEHGAQWLKEQTLYLLCGPCSNGGKIPRYVLIRYMVRTNKKNVMRLYSLCPEQHAISLIHYPIYNPINNPIYNPKRSAACSTALADRKRSLAENSDAVKAENVLTNDEAMAKTKLIVQFLDQLLKSYPLMSFYVGMFHMDAVGPLSLEVHATAAKKELTSWATGRGAGEPVLRLADDSYAAGSLLTSTGGCELIVLPGITSYHSVNVQPIELAILQNYNDLPVGVRLWRQPRGYPGKSVNGRRYGLGILWCPNGIRGNPALKLDPKYAESYNAHFAATAAAAPKAAAAVDPFVTFPDAIRLTPLVLGKLKGARGGGGKAGGGDLWEGTEGAEVDSREEVELVAGHAWDQIVDGRTFTFSGVIPTEKKQFFELIKEKGGKAVYFQGNKLGDATVLIVGRNGKDSGKYRLAQKKGLQIVSSTRLLTFLSSGLSPLDTFSRQRGGRGVQRGGRGVQRGGGGVQRGGGGGYRRGGVGGGGRGRRLRQLQWLRRQLWLLLARGVPGFHATREILQRARAAGGCV